MSALLMFVALAIGSSVGIAPSDEQLAIQDRQKFPAELWPGIYYLSTSGVEDEVERESLTIAIKLMLMHCSRQTDISLSAPVPIEGSDTLYRINLYDLKWDPKVFKQVTALNGYDRFPDHLTLRADWLLITLADTRDSPAYYLLAYGEVPKNVNRVWEILEVETNPKLRYGLIEGDSQVSKQGIRRLEELPTIRGQAWRTRDVLKLNLENDPLEQPEGDFVHDAEEHIVLKEMFDGVSGNTGVVPFYFLTDGKGNRVDKADVRIVEDTTEFRGYREIATPGSCIQCHASGGRYPTKDDFRDLVSNGIEGTSYDYNTATAIRNFYFVNLNKKIGRWNEDYTAMVLARCGVTPVSAAANFNLAVDRYDEPLNLNRAAWELGSTPEELRLALDWAHKTDTRLPARAAGLMVERKMPRDAAESGGLLALKDILERWNAR